jgi:hypothetical protein
MGTFPGLHFRLFRVSQPNQAGLHHEGKGAVCFALGAPHHQANVLPRAALGQVCNVLLEAAVKELVLVSWSWSLKGSARSSSIRWQACVAQLLAFTVWKVEGANGGVPAAGRPWGACLTPSWPTSAVAVVWSAEWTANFAGWQWSPRGAARAMRAANIYAVQKSADIALDDALYILIRLVIGKFTTYTPRP